MLLRYCSRTFSQSIDAPSKNQWRLALPETNKAMKSTNQEIKKGAEVILALAPNMLFRAPNSRERELSTRAKWSTRFNKFWAGDFQSQHPA